MTISVRSQLARPVAERVVECFEVGAHRGGIVGERVGVGRVGVGERGSDRVDDIDHEHRVEPHVRVDGGTRVEREDVEDLDHPRGAALDGGFDVGLESAPDDENDIGGLDRLTCFGGEFEVVWFLTGGREVGDRGEIAAHPFGGPGERVDAGDHREVAAGAASVVGTAGGTDHDEDHHREGGADSDEHARH